MRTAQTAPVDYAALTRDIKSWGRALGFQQVGITDTELGEHETHLLNWLAAGRHGEMGYMAQHGTRRTAAELLPGTLRVISYAWITCPAPQRRPTRYCSICNWDDFALRARRDYHKMVRTRLQKLADQIAVRVGPFGYRAFTDSAPVLEKALAKRPTRLDRQAHHLLTHDAGSWFFLGELYTDLPLQSTRPPPTIAAPARPASTSARRRQSSRPTSSMPGAAFPISPSNCAGRYRSNCDRSWVIASTAATTARWFVRGTSFPSRHRNWTLRRAMASMRRSSSSCLRGARKSFLGGRGLGDSAYRLRVLVTEHSRGTRHAQRSDAVTASLRARGGHPSALVREHVAWALAQL